MTHLSSLCMVPWAQLLKPYGKTLINQAPHLQEKLSRGVGKMNEGRMAPQNGWDGSSLCLSGSHTPPALPPRSPLPYLEEDKATNSFRTRDPTHLKSNPKLCIKNQLMLGARDIAMNVLEITSCAGGMKSPPKQSQRNVWKEK